MAHAVTPVTINLQDIEITHISDSIGQQSQAVPYARYIAEIQELELALRTTKSRLEEHITALTRLQYEYESQREQLFKATEERDEASAATIHLTTRLTERETIIGTLRAERNILRDQLTESNSALLTHTLPERAEFEALKQALTAAGNARSKAEARVASTNAELGYVRESYQAASNSASSLAANVSDLEAEKTVLERKASGEMARAQQLSKDGANKLLRQEKRRLEAMVRSRDELLARKEEEIARLKEAGRGRMGTRASSVPRSPGPARLGSPMRLEPPGRGLSGSRQASPVNGHVARAPHPLRRGLQ